MKKLFIIFLLFFVSSICEAKTENDLREKFGVIRIHIDEDVNFKAYEKKALFLLGIEDDLKFNVNAFRFIRGNRAFYNKATNVVLVPVDVPNFYLKYAIFHEYGHLLWKNGGKNSEEWMLIKSKLNPKDVSEYALTNEEEFFCEVIAAKKGGKGFGDLDETLNKIIFKFS